MIYKWILKPIFFRFDAEKVHYSVFSLLKTLLFFSPFRWIATKIYTVQSPVLSRQVMGLNFPNPVGLAAGFDKDAKLYKELACLGFGFIEIGTLTPKAQEGNPKPRLFRLPLDEALINRMGFNNGGVKAAINRLKGRDTRFLVGGNIGKNKVTPNEKAAQDYQYCFEELFPYVDYFVVNVSSPNTPNLRELQEKKPLTELLISLQILNAKKSKRKPILLKIAPDLNHSQLDDIIDIVKTSKIDGIIATNTTIDRSSLKTEKSIVDQVGAGGLSGKPVRNVSNGIIKYIADRSDKAFCIIAVGGVFTAEDTIEKLEAGADLVQVYTGFIYEGPGMVKNINKGLIKHYGKT